MTFKTAFVTGSTGLLRNNLVRELAGSGVSVRALARSPEKAKKQFEGLNLEVVSGDMNHVSGFAPRLHGAAGRHMTMADHYAVLEKVTGIQAPTRKIPAALLYAIAVGARLGRG